MKNMVSKGIFLGALLLLAWLPVRADELVQGWDNPPNQARLRAYWWWLNGNVTKASITHDLEQMKAKGFGGAVIFDANGSAQEGNTPAPHGPTFFSPEWRELYKHTLREADRLGLEISLNIQSGWNLGGPVVTAEDAAKKYIWSESRVSGGTAVALKLAEPKSRENFYQDSYVVAYRMKDAPAAKNLPGAALSASSSQPDHAAGLAADDDTNTFWVSDGTESGQGPSREHPAWLQLTYPRPITISELHLAGRAKHGPRDGELQVATDGQSFRTVKTFALVDGHAATIQFDPVTAAQFRVVFFNAYDSTYPQSARNVQVAEVKLGAADATGHFAHLKNWKQKALQESLEPFSTPDSSPLFAEDPATAGESEAAADEVVNLTTNLDANGILHWNAPAGEWQVFRFGYTVGDHAYVSTSSDGWGGFALDVYSATAFTHYWDKIVEPLIQDAGPLAGKSLKYLHTDSWEIELANWTPLLREEFQKRRGYDLLPWLPVLTGRIISSREESDRFLFDYRKTLGDLAIDDHYRLFRDRAHAHGIGIHPESGGPHAVPIDAQRCLGWDDVPMSEFWAWSWTHRIGDANRFFVKQPASAAHTYGHKYVFAEGFTDIGPHWQESIWSNLKPAFDKALGEGLNVLVWHAFVCAPDETGLPGQQYFAGTHMNPKVTWWEKSGPFLRYIDRCQWMLQQGNFAADVLYYYGDHVPNFTQHKHTDPAHIQPGYDYDVITEEALIERATVRDGRIFLPDGINYRMLIIPDREVISLPVLKKIRELVAAGATVVGTKPLKGETLSDEGSTDAEVTRLADELWGGQVGSGHVISGVTGRQALLQNGIQPDCEFPGANDQTLDYLHRTTGDAEIYFTASRTNFAVNVTAAFRVTGKAPELWNAVTGERQFAAAYEEKDGRTYVPLEFAPYGSWFVVFREPAAAHPALAQSNHEALVPVQPLTGSWTVHFDPQWGGPASAQFDDLQSWTKRSEPGIKYYSGTAVYAKTFNVAAVDLAGKPRVYLDLGDVRELAEVKINGHSCGITWCPPWRVEVTGALKPGDNDLQIEVVNFWANRVIGDASLPAAQRLTRTNIRKLTADTTLTDAGLLGPVTLMKQP